MTVCFLAEQVNHLILVEPPSTDKGWPPALREYVHHKVASNASAEIADRLKTMSDEELWAVDWSCELAIGEQCYLLSSVLVPPPCPPPLPLPISSASPCSLLLLCSVVFYSTHTAHIEDEHPRPSIHSFPSQSRPAANTRGGNCLQRRRSSRYLAFRFGTAF